MDKELLTTGAVATTGVCSIVSGCSIQEMLLYVVVLLVGCLAWQIGYAAWNCRIKRKRIDLIEARRLANVKPYRH
jgi:hypothetical protein